MAPSIALLALIGSTALTQALLIPPSLTGFSLSSVLGSSSSRPSLNFGPDLAHSRYHHSSAPHASLSPFTTGGFLQAQHVYQPSVDAALDKAHAVVRDLHPSAHYHISDRYESKHSGVLHVHFRQVVPLADRDGTAGDVGSEGEWTWLPVVDGLINVNVEIATGKVISFGDSFWQGEERIECSSTNVEEMDQAPQDQDQFVFSTKSTSTCIKRHSSSHPHSLISSLLDPRLSLLSFLSLAYSHLPHFHPSKHDDHLSSIYITHDFLPPSSQHRVFGPSTTSSSIVGVRGQLMKLHDVFGALEAVDAQLAFVQREKGAEVVGDKEKAGDGLRLVWGLGYRARDNWYESYVDAEQSGGQPQVRHVVDYVKDWRPTTTDSTEDWLPMWLKGDPDLLRSLQAIKENTEVEVETEIMIVRTSISKSSDSILRQLKSIFNSLVGPSSERSSEDKPHKPPSHPNPYPAPEPIPTRGPFYRVFPWGTNDPTEGKRELLARPGDRLASPQGWHIIPAGKGAKGGRPVDIGERGWSDRTEEGLRFDDTRSNNVFAQENWEGADAWELNFRPSGLEQALSKPGEYFNTSHLKFDYKLGWGDKDSRKGKEIDPKSYVNVSITELFFTCNEIHDLYYRYGFDEESGNFQEYNGDKGGKGNDAVIANAQDGSGYNNANFATPPDGRRGRMRMYVWNGDLPWRDGDLESGIVIHEYSHGLSTRLTGGPANSGCLGWGEAGGMGEGWGDFLATMIRMHGANPKDFSMGEWASGAKGGIRRYKYSMNITTNPETYKYLDKPGYWGVHAIGAVWAEMLYVVGELLIAKHGFNPSLFPPLPDATSGLIDPEDTFYTTSGKTGKRVPKHGNSLIFQLVLDGMKLQPCRPTFMNARDATLSADEVLTGGENACEIWDGFAQRGLGVGAELRGSTPWGGGVRIESFELPTKCKDAKKRKLAAAWK